MKMELERLCANRPHFFQDTADWTEHGICFADELVEHGDFPVCPALIREKRFQGNRDVCSLDEEAEHADIPEFVSGGVLCQPQGKEDRKFVSAGTGIFMVERIRRLSVDRSGRSV